MCNLMMATPEVFGRKLDLIKGYCAQVGRDIRDIEVTKIDRVCLAPSAEAADAKWEARGGRLPEGYRSLVGSPEQAIERLQGFAKQGLDTVFISVGTDDLESLELFAKDVIPALN